MASLTSARTEIGARLIFAVLRWLERISTPNGLRRMVAPFIWARVACKRRHEALPLPGCLLERSRRREEVELGNLRASPPRHVGGYEDAQFQLSPRQQRANYLNSVLEFFPEQLGTAKWRDHLRICGVDHLEMARQQKHPVVLAFCHFGPYFLLRYWLRAAGFPAATLVEGRSADRLALKRLKDAVSPFPEIPIAFHHEDELRETIAFIATGNPLLVAIDVLRGSQMGVPIDEQWQFGMASGAIRLAMRQGAELIPCSIVEEGTWRFRLELGPSVPDEVMQSGDALRAGQYLLQALLPILRTHPEQCTERLIKQFRRVHSTTQNESIYSGQVVA